jgi:hypothetical protein
MAYIGQTPSAVPLDGDDIADDIVDSQHYAAGSIDTAHLADDQITLAKMAAGTDGNIISYDASGNPVAIATGSDGQVLTSAGAGAAPAFEAAFAGITTAVEARLGSTVAVANTTWVKLTFTDDSTVSGEHKSYDEDGDYDAGNSKFVAPANGKYFVHASLNFFSSNVDRKVYRAGVYVNGTLVHWSEVDCSWSGNYQFPQVTALLKLDSSDYVEIYGWQSSGASSNVQADNAVSNFKIHRLS